MKVCLGSPGRFHTFDLARQLSDRGMLQRLYTGLPRWRVDLPDPAKVTCFPWTMGPPWLANRCGLDSAKRRLNVLALEWFDHAMARRLEPCQVFHCLSGFGAAAHALARRRDGALTVCDRGSSHILYQDRILAEEYARWEIPYRPIDPRVIERELWEYELCDVICTPSSFAYCSFLEMGVAHEKLERIPYGVDLGLFRPMPKQDSVFRVIYAGALSLQKGIPHLLEALHGVNVELWLIGPVEPEIRPFLKKHEGDFRYMGVKRRADLAWYYSQGSVFVMPSIQEGLALVQAQAMACGLPVIATTNTGATDLFTDGREGFIVPIRSPEAIRETVLHLARHPDACREMGLRARERTRSMGGWDQYGGQIEAMYHARVRDAVKGTLAHSAV